MDDRVSRLEAQVELLAGLLRELDARLKVLEAGAGPGGTAGEVIVPPVGSDAVPLEPASTGDKSDLVATLSWVGRTLVVLGGAYLLRALTDSGLLPVVQGVGLGVAYALGWVVLADRSATAAQWSSAAFHGLAGVLVAFPLLFEATVRFKLLTPWLSATTLASFTALALVVAWRRSLQSLAWLATVAALLTFLSLMNVTGAVEPMAVALILLGVGTLWLGYVRGWILLRWPVAILADLTVLAMTLRAAGPGSADLAGSTIPIQLFLVGAYFASVVARTLFLGRDLVVFEVFQSSAALAVGFGGAIYVVHSTGWGTAVLGLCSLMFGAGCYAVAFAFVERRQPRRKNFVFYTSLAVVFTLVGTALVLEPLMLALVLAALALATAWLGDRYSRLTLRWHSVTYLLAATLVSGLLVCAAFAALAPASIVWRPVTIPALIVLAAGTCVWILQSAEHDPVDSRPRLPRLVLLLILVWSGVGIADATVGPALAGRPGGGADAGIVATVRTAVLVAAVLLLSWAGRSRRLQEAAWLVYPVLLLTGIKLALEDFATSRPATLFVALALYGGALIISPRLSRDKVSITPHRTRRP